MSKHTQGPWIVTECDSLTMHVYDDKGEDGLLYPIAEVRNGDPDELKANANLIAAAPDLLAVLESIELNHAARNALTMEQFNALRAAIAKARG